MTKVLAFFRSWWLAFVIAGLFGFYIYAESTVHAYNNRIQANCQRACDPYRVVACVKEPTIVRAVCFSDDPYIANMIVVGDDMDRLEYWRDHCGRDQDERIPTKE